MTSMAPGTSTDGPLTDAQVEPSRKAFGSNIIYDGSQKNWLFYILREPLYIGWATYGIGWYLLQEVHDMMAREFLFGHLALSMLAAAAQGLYTEREARIEAMNSEVTVIRNGKTTRTSATHLVVGDIIKVNSCSCIRFRAKPCRSAKATQYPPTVQYKTLRIFKSRKGTSRAMYIGAGRTRASQRLRTYALLGKRWSQVKPHCE